MISACFILEEMGDMNKRLLVATVLTMLVIGGLIAGLFAGSIQSSLTLPMMETMMAPAHAPTAQPSPVRTMTTVQPQMQPDLLAQDTFQRANQALWGAASDGRQWGGDANMQQGFAIANASGQIAQSQGVRNALLGPAKKDVDVQMSGMINHFGNGVNFGAVVRWVDTNTFYKAFLDGTHLVLVKHINGQGTQIASQNFAAQGKVLYKLHVRAIGAMLFAKAWRADAQEPRQWMIVATDSSLNTGQAGVRVLVQSDTIVNITSFAVANAAMDNS